MCQAEELRQRLRDLEERERREGKKMADEEALRKIRLVEEQIDILNKKLSLAKQVRVHVSYKCVRIWLLIFQCMCKVCNLLLVNKVFFFFLSPLNKLIRFSPLID